MRTFLAVVIVLVALGTPCTGAPESQQIKRISDVGEPVQDIVADGGLSDVYKFEGIFFIGDMELSQYREIRRRFEDMLEEGEVLLRISNHRAWPDSKRLPRYEEIDISVFTCTDKQSMEKSTLCLGGRFWECRLGAEGIEIVGLGGWAI